MLSTGCLDKMWYKITNLAPNTHQISHYPLSKIGSSYGKLRISFSAASPKIGTSHGGLRLQIFVHLFTVPRLGLSVGSPFTIKPFNI